MISHNKSQWDGKPFEKLFDIEIIETYQKVFTQVVEEGNFMVKNYGEILNSKSEWHQPKIIRATILQGAAENRVPNSSVRYVANVQI